MKKKSSLTLQLNKEVLVELTKNQLNKIKAGMANEEGELKPVESIVCLPTEVNCHPSHFCYTYGCC